MPKMHDFMQIHRGIWSLKIALKWVVTRRLLKEPRAKSQEHAGPSANGKVQSGTLDARTNANAGEDP
jgi:hypothetical protein